MLKSKDITLLTKVRIVKAMVFLAVMYGCKSWTIKKVSTKELMPSNCGVGEDSWEPPGQQREQTCQSWRRSTLNIHWKDWCWSWNSSILVIWCEQLTHWKSPWCWERLKAEGAEGIRGWDGWMASPMQWTWAWADFRRWWGTKRPGVLPGHGVTKNWIWPGDWATEQQQHQAKSKTNYCGRSQRWTPKE